MRRAIVIAGLILFAASPLHAQDDDSLLVRGFGLATLQQFAAGKTFDATIGSALQPFFGGGVSFIEKGVFLDVAVSRFQKTAQRAFMDAALGQSGTVTVTPLEISAGYRFHRTHRLIPYAGAGFGKYWFSQRSSSDVTGEPVDANHIGYLAFAGVEYRLQRLVRVSGDAHYTHIPGILGGDPSLSKDFNEDDLGGIAGRFRVIIGR